MTLPDWAVALDSSPPGALRLDITALRRTPGNRRRHRMVVEGMAGIELPSVDVTTSSVDLDLVLEVVGDQLVAAGELGAVWTAPCRRCLEPVVGRVTVTVQEIFEKKAVEGETYPLEEEYVDLAPMVRESLVLSLPIAPLCSPECAGPAPDVFPTLGNHETHAGAADDSDDDAPEAPEAGGGRDPRWAALDALRSDDDGQT